MENNNLIRYTTDNYEAQQRGIIENFKMYDTPPHPPNLKALFYNNAEYQYIIVVEIISPNS